MKNCWLTPLIYLLLLSSCQKGVENLDIKVEVIDYISQKPIDDANVCMVGSVLGKQCGQTDKSGQINFQIDGDEVFYDVTKVYAIETKRLNYFFNDNGFTSNAYLQTQEIIGYPPTWFKIDTTNFSRIALIRMLLTSTEDNHYYLNSLYVNNPSKPVIKQLEYFKLNAPFPSDNFIVKVDRVAYKAYVDLVSGGEIVLIDTISFNSMDTTIIKLKL